MSASLLCKNQTKTTFKLQTGQLKRSKKCVQNISSYSLQIEMQNWAVYLIIISLDMSFSELE